MMLILIRLKMMILLAIGIFPPTWGNFISMVVKTMMRMEMIPMMISSLRRLLASGESAFLHIFLRIPRPPLS